MLAVFLETAMHVHNLTPSHTQHRHFDAKAVELAIVGPVVLEKHHYS